jgi:Arm DNA-binding domain
MRVKLTDSAIRSYQPRAAQYAVGDAACPGLCVRITPKGVKSFAFAYRSKASGKVAWLTIGRYPDVPLTRAREVANDARKTVANGGTPVRRAEADKKAKTYAEVVELYLRRAADVAALRSRDAHDVAAHWPRLRLE